MFGTYRAGLIRTIGLSVFLIASAGHAEEGDALRHPVSVVSFASHESDDTSGFTPEYVASVEPWVVESTPVDSEANPRRAIEKTHAPVLRRNSDDTDAAKGGAAIVEGQGTGLAAGVTASEDTAGVGRDNDSNQGDAKDAAGLHTEFEVPTATELKLQLEEIAASEALDEPAKAELSAVVNQAMEWLKVADDLEGQSEQARQSFEQLPERLTQLQEQLRSAASEQQLPVADGMTIDELEKAIVVLDDELASLREKLASREKQTADLKSKRKSTQEKLQQIAEQEKATEAQLAKGPPEGTSALHAKASQWEKRTRLRLLQAREKFLKAEAKYSLATDELQPLQSDHDRQSIARREKLRKHFDKVLTGKREEEVQRRLDEAKITAQQADPALRQLALRNAELADTLSRYHEKMRLAQGELESITRQFAAQEKSFLNVQQRVEDVGMTEAIGVLLRSQQHELMNDVPIRKRAIAVADELTQVELEWMDVNDERKAMWEIDKLTTSWAKQLSSRVSEDEARSMVRELLETRRQYLGELRTDLSAYETILADLNSALNNSAKVTREHRAYIKERVLWIRSADPVSTRDVQEAREGLADLFALDKWAKLVGEVGQFLQSNLVMSLASLTALTICLVLLDRLKDRISRIGESAAVKSASRFAPTMEVSLETFLLASILPGICFVVSWFILISTDTVDLVQAIGAGLKWTSAMWLALSILQQTVRPEGLAECHFGWHVNNIRVIRHNLRLLILFGLPAVFVVMLIESYHEGHWSNSLGRLSFMSGMVVMALFMHRLLDPYRSTRGVWANRDVWLFKARHVLHGICVAIPFALGVVTAVGYVYSSYQLAYRAQLSLWLVLTVVLLHGLVGRYLTIARRKTAMRHMQRRQQEANDSDETPPDEQLDFREIGQQVRNLLRGTAAVACVVGALVIWADMFPALRILDRTELWSTTTVVSEKVEADDGTLQLQTSMQQVSISLADGLLGLVLLLATVMAARNIPGLLNVTVFERLPIDFGTRYALTAVSRYVISLAGIVSAFYVVGVTWSSVQWLVAAMTVGLGFGLQEIFANFVSGLIILTERPVRVGDMVTVGGITGKVTRVQIRATTITDYDRRELVVPNKRFITEDVINWTLSDPVTRVVLPVGIGYDCDPQLARERLLEAASQHPMVLAEPEPTAIFMGFGDSTLDLELRVFIVGRDHAFQVRDELNRAINTLFRAANLEIAYPQRDLHIRTVDAKALGEHLQRPPGKAA